MAPKYLSLNIFRALLGTVRNRQPSVKYFSREGVRNQTSSLQLQELAEVLLYNLPGS
jgi:hypothetical protein